jgi:hypothetical protein
VWKAYALDFVSAALAVLLVAVIVFATQPKQEHGLMWAGAVYSSKQEFKGFLKSKGLSYKTWVVRNPGVAPWEPDTALEATKARWDRVDRLLLAAIGLIVATGCALVLSQELRTVRPLLVRASVALVGAVLTGLLVVVIWFGTQAKQEPGLSWGGTVYTSKEAFSGYLKSKGLSYKTWVVRNPGVAPWEPKSVPAATTTSEDWVERLPLAAFGWILATGCALLLLRGLRPVIVRVARGSVASFSPGALPNVKTPAGNSTAMMGGVAREPTPFFGPQAGRIGKSPAGRPAAVAPIRRLGTVAAGATRRLRVSVPIYGGRLIGVVRADGPLPTLMRERNISGSDVAFGVLAVVMAVMFGVFVVFLASM